ncbi:MAG: hypothetical protein LBU10_03980 [Endomicrobium sp.]|jgi:hypothetical protein|nr:hypothetical protein [Endomicrobium sp.]
MKKQIVSLILALMLTFGYTGKIFAVDDGTFDQKSSPEGFLKDKEKIAEAITTDQKIQDAYDNATLKFLIGQVTSVYKFMNGQLTSIVNADKTISVYFNGKAKGNIQRYDDEGGTYRWTSINLDETDVQAFENFKKTNPGATFANYLVTAFGVSETVAARVTSLQNNTSKVADFLSAGVKSGIGAEVSITIGDSVEGVTATFSSPANKRLETINYLGETTAKWVYGNNSSIPTQYIKMGEASDSETSFTVTEYSDGTDKYKDERGNIIPVGQAAYTWEHSVSSTTLKTNGIQASVANISEADKKITTTYVYDPKTNQKISEKDVKTGEITTYKDGKPVAVYYPAAGNTAPRMKQEFVYGNNGLIHSVIDYQDNTSHTRQKISIYSDDGRFLGSSEDLNISEATFRQTLRELDVLINQTGTTADDIASFFTSHKEISSFQFSYMYLINNPALVEAVFMKKDVVVSTTATGSTTTYSSMGDIFREEYERAKARDPKTTIKDVIKTLSDEEEKNESLDSSEKVWQALYTIYSAIVEGKVNFTITTTVQTEERPDLDTNVETTTSTTITTSTTTVSGRETQYDNVEHDEESGKGKIEKETTTTTTTTTTYDRVSVTSVLFEINVPIYKINAQGEKELDYTAKSNTSYATGTTVEHKTDTKIDTSTNTTYYDPAVIGKAQSFTDADGNVIDEQTAQDKIATGEPVYIKLAPDSINMFDGAGFKDITTPQKGEEIFVKVEDQDMFDAFKGAIGTDAQVMVTGVVTNDIDGKICLEVYNTQNGAGIGFSLSSTDDNGYAIGDKLNAMKEEIEALSQQEGSWVSKNTQTNQKIFQQAGITNSQGYLDDWKTGWNELAKLVGGGK